jgi:hypothetical protein
LKTLVKSPLMNEPCICVYTFPRLNRC